MKEERLQILKMVEERTITVEEAAKLLEAIKGATQGEHQAYEGPSFDEKVKEFSQNAEGFAKDLGDKMGSFYKDVEPKLKKATKAVVEKTASIVDEISKALNESLKNFDKDCCKEETCKDENCCDETCCENDAEAHDDCCCCENEQENKDNGPKSN